MHLEVCVGIINVAVSISFLLVLSCEVFDCSPYLVKENKKKPDDG